MSLPYVTAGQAEKISREIAQEEIEKIPAPSGGTKLYKHDMTFTDDTGFEVACTIVSKNAEQYESGLPTDYVSLRGTISRNGDNYIIVAFYSPEIVVYNVDNSSLSILEVDTPYTDYQDTVTEL